MSILVYSSDAVFMASVSKALQPLNYSIVSFQNRKDAINHACSTSQFLFIIDEEEEGIDFLTALKLVDEHLPVLFVLSEKNVEMVYKAFELGSDDCIEKGITGKELFHRVKSILKRTKLDSSKIILDKPVMLGSSVLDFNGSSTEVVEDRIKVEICADERLF